MGPPFSVNNRAFYASGAAAAASDCLLCCSPMGPRPLMLAVAIGLIAGAANAQTTGGGVGGGSDQPAGGNDLPYLGLPFGGTKIAAIGLIDRDWRRRLAIGGEVSTAGQISGEQSQRNGTSTNAFVSRHRDTVFSATAKFGVTGGRVRASAVGGAGGAPRCTAGGGPTPYALPP